MTQKKSSNVAKEILDLHPDEFFPYAPLRKDTKDDLAKPIAGVIGDFGLALMEIAKVGTLGAQKYSRKSWETLENGEQRYNDAMWRHLLVMHIEDLDPEFQLPHLAHLAWNALAQLELRLRREKKDAEG